MLPIAWIPSGPELWIVVLIIVVLFGAKKLPEIGKSLAEGIHEFKKAAKGAKDDDSEDSKTDTSA